MTTFIQGGLFAVRRICYVEEKMGLCFVPTKIFDYPIACASIGILTLRADQQQYLFSVKIN